MKLMRFFYQLKNGIQIKSSLLWQKYQRISTKARENGKKGHSFFMEKILEERSVTS
jgi:hypothetical protein